MPLLASVLMVSVMTGTHRSVATVSSGDWLWWIGLAASLLAGTVLIVAGTTKLFDLADWRAQVGELGVPALLGLMVPWCELTLGALLVVGVGYPYVPGAAALMVFGFSVVLARELAAGRRPRCACFGSLSATTIGHRDLVRNGAVIALCVLAMAR